MFQQRTFPLPGIQAGLLIGAFIRPLSDPLNATTSTPPLHITCRNATFNATSNPFMEPWTTKKLQILVGFVLPLLLLGCMAQQQGFWGAL